MNKNRLYKLMEGKSGEILLWSVVFLLLTVNNARFSLRVSVLLALLGLVGMIVISLITRFSFIPNLLTKRRTRFFWVASSLSIVFLTIVFGKADMFIVKDYLPPMPQFMKPAIHFEKPDSFNLMPYIKTAILIIGSYLVTLLFFLISKAKQDESKARELEAEKGSMELKFLKSQINPHFLFNALNNLYSMIYTGDKNAANSVLRLSELLRYVTDDCQAESLPIEKEIQYIESYIDFEQMRMEKKMNVSVVKQVANQQLMVPPMLFQPFVENSFKHSRIENDSNAFIHISWVQMDDLLIFTVENSKSQFIKKENGISRNGIGISNVKKRLELLYPERHTLTINDHENQFSITLFIQL